MKNPRKTLLLTLLVLVGAAAVLAPSVGILASRHRESVQRELQKLVGQDVHFAGLEVRLLGWPGFAAKDLRIADDPRFAATPFLRARELILGIQFWRLLLGRVVIDSLTLREPELQIIADETGLLNIDVLSRRNKTLAPLPQLAAPPTERRPARVTFALASLRIDQGRVIYLDRSIKEPAELQLREIDLKLTGLDALKTAKLRLAAALTEGLGQDVHIEGQLNPSGPERSWLRRDMNLKVQLDSLRVPVVARAVAWLRDKIPSELDVTGPMSLQATATGTLAQPRLENVTLRAPLLGSSEYNATITGDIAFSERRSWEDAQIKGRLKIDPLPMDRLRNLRWFRQHLSPAIATDGAISVYSRFEGTWATLRVGALVRADKSEWRYKESIRKALDRPAELRARIARQKNKFFFHESELASGPNRIGFTGFIDTGEQPKLHLRLYNRNGLVPEWRALFAQAALVGISGQTELNVVVERFWRADDDNWSVDGYFKLIDGVFTFPENGRKIDDVNATILLKGQQAKITDARFRLGTSTFALDGVAPNLFDAKAAYKLHSTRLNLVDLPPLNVGLTGQLNDFSSQGTARWVSGALFVNGMVVASKGRFADFDFRDLRAKIAWSKAGLILNDLALGSFDGALRADGYLAGTDDNSAALEMAVQVDDLSLAALSRRFMPAIEDRVQGRLEGRGQFVMTTTDAHGNENTLKGTADTAIRRGAITNFNLVSQLLLRGSGMTVSPQSTARLSPALARLLTQRDTVFESFKAKFIVEPQRLRSDEMVIATADYTITGAGWIGFDRSTKWNGLIVLSSKVTQEVQRDYRLIRYLLDRRGRLAITFRVEGTIPNVKIRLDNRALAQTLRGGAPSLDKDGEAPDPASESTMDNKKWLPDALERLLNR